MTIDTYSVALFDSALEGKYEELARLPDGGRPKDVSDLRFAR